jgi:hypothetical protein
VVAQDALAPADDADAARRDTGAAPRRAVLRGAGALVTLTGLAVAGCARAPKGPDELEAPLAAARSDAAVAAAAVAAFPDLAGRLTPLADARRAHADALAAEVRRARPDRAPAVDAVPAPAARPTSAQAALTALRGSLGTARDAAGAIVLTTASYRCGLLTSVSASCAGLVTVLA